MLPLGFPDLWSETLVSRLNYLTAEDMKMKHEGKDLEGTCRLLLQDAKPDFSYEKLH
jgi:hypothetical protein